MAEDLQPKTEYIYVAIGNTDDKLSQREWSEFVDAVREHISWFAEKVHGEWYSLPDKPWQNCCWGFDITPFHIPYLQVLLQSLAAKYRQDSICWSKTETQFLQTVRAAHGDE